MENKKKKLYIVIGLVVVIVAAIVIYFCATYLPRLQVGKEISNLLQPLLTEENQSMHLDVTADLVGESMNLHSDIYLVKEDEIKYVIMDQYDFPIYIVDNVLYLENGHAFKIAEEMQSQPVKYEELFLQIAAAYEMFDITCVKTDAETGYSVNVTGEQVQELLAMAVPTSQGLKSGEQELLNSIQSLNLQMIARNEKLDRIEMSGSAEVDGTAVQVSIVISEFQVLESGEYAIPNVVKEAMKTIDKDSLFSLTEDLYRLMIAFDRFTKQETLNGTVTLSANCGIINFNRTYNLKDFENIENTGEVSVDTEGVENLPAMIGLLCMEGEISCTELGTGYEYKLALDEVTMQKMAEMVVPDLVNYIVTMTEGTVIVTLENDSVSAIVIEIEGSIKVLFSEVPAEVGVIFEY